MQSGLPVSVTLTRECLRRNLTFNTEKIPIEIESIATVTLVPPQLERCLSAGRVNAMPHKIRQSQSGHGFKRKLKFTAFCILQVVALLALGETLVRVCGFDKPLAGSIFFGFWDSDDKIHRSDSLLFFSLRPNADARWQGVEVTTNSLGLRCPEIGPKEPNEFRILSLGESSTFGASVENDQTYSARLEELLQRGDRSRKYRVINAGVSSYTSFQSLKYLENRGLPLQPDLVLFYHEMNDFLATEYTDRELYYSQSHAWHRNLAEWSALYRAISFFTARRKIETMRVVELESHEKNLDAAQVHSIPAMGKGVAAPTGRWRVSREERTENFRQLLALCRKHNIQLVIIHPSYADSKKHTCELTEFCGLSNVPLYDAYDSLHPPNIRQQEYFLDACHPNRQGHSSLARGLFDFLANSHLVPFRK